MTTESKVKAQYDRVAEIYDRRWRSYSLTSIAP